ncbi:hypothetical protein BDR07DRAFT_1433596 [Suillus spraguei]|nr:hypothetical protein BDR07DRAFT_1433596 [Suillus spraguei]
MTGFSIRTLTSERHTKLARKTDVVVTFIRSPENGNSVMNDDIPIPWKILTFLANSNTYRSITIPSAIGVCTVKEKDSGVLSPQLGTTLSKGGVILKFSEEAGGLYWENADGNTEETASTEGTINDDFVIKNEYEDTKLALCLFDDDDVCLPIVNLGELPKDEEIKFNGKLSVQVHVMENQILGKPLTSPNTPPLVKPMAIAEISKKSFKLYTERNGTTILK